MNNLRKRLMRVFLIEILGFILVGVIISILQLNVTTQYKDTTDNMVNEYHLTSTAYNLISEFNSYALDSSSTSISGDKASILASESQINNLYKLLDKTISGSNTQVSYIGLKNTINSLVSEINTGISGYAAGHYIAQSSYNQANDLYGFVATDSGTFINNALANISMVRSQLNKTYEDSILIGIITFLCVIVGTIIFAFKFSGVIVNPIDQLTTTAEQISGGDMTATIQPDLLDNKDETGRLANAFNLMFSILKNKLIELNDEKENIEKKVVERTGELNNERARLEASINSLDVGFIMTDSDNNIFLINNAAISILSYKVPESNNDVIVDDKLVWTTDLVEEKLSKSLGFKSSLNKVISDSKPILNKEFNYNGKILTLYMAPVIDHTNKETALNGLGVVVLIEDITEAKIAERSKDEFFSIASHELRTPLTSIRGNASMIMDFYKDTLKDIQLKEMVDDIHTSSVRLIEIVNDFLDLSRLEQGKMSFDYMATSLEKIIEGVSYEMKVVINARNIYLKIDKLTLNTLPKVWVDENRLKQVVYNLIGNAVKFTDKGGISITTQIQPGNKFIKVTLADTGRGMTPASQQLLFHKFQQASSSLLTRDTTRGTGLGLYISKMIIESMGGEIVLESSTVDKGSVFSFTIPIATKEELVSSTSTVAKIDSTTGLEVGDIIDEAQL
jgi:signal transduction histidine kinase